MWFSIFAYLSIFFILSYFTFNEYRIGHTIDVIGCRKHMIKPIIVIVLFVGLRAFVYTDFENYYPAFDMLDNSVESLLHLIIFKGWEIGFIVYMWICKILVHDYFAWNFLSACIDMTLLYLIIKRYSKSPVFSLLVFFTMGCMDLEFNVLRHAKAILIFLYALRYIEDRKFWKYFTCIVIAVFFHTSAILYLPFYFILNRRWPKLVIWGIFAVGLVVYFLQIGIMSNILQYLPIGFDDRADYLMDKYVVSTGSAYGLSFGSIERMIIYILVALNYDRYKGPNGQTYMFGNMFFCLFIVFFYLTENVTIVQRFQYMFYACYWFIYPWLILGYLNVNKIISVTLACVIFMKILIVSVAPHQRYETILLPHMSYEQRVIYTHEHF